MRRYENFTDVDLKIDAADVKARVNNSLNADPCERSIYMKHRSFKTVLCAAAVTALLAGTAYAMSDTGRELIENIISYFSSEAAVELTSRSELEKYNEPINKSVEGFGYKFTLENVAGDDNFIHIFYTLSSEKELTPKFYGMCPYLLADCILNGNEIGHSNHDDGTGYLADSHTYKGVMKYNISAVDIPDISKLEILVFNYPQADEETDGNTLTEMFEREDRVIKQLILGERPADEDMENVLYISEDIDITEIRADSVTTEVNRYIGFMDAVLERVIISPFANQLVIKTDIEEDNMTENELLDKLHRMNQFAIFDENDNCLDIINSGLLINTHGECENSFEFLKADKNTRQLKLVPWYLTDIDEESYDGEYEIKAETGTYPVEFKVSEYGKVIVTDVRVSDGKIEADYYTDGFVRHPDGVSFAFLDTEGRNTDIEFTEKGLTGYCTGSIDHAENSYTYMIDYREYDAESGVYTSDKAVSREALAEKIKYISTYPQPYERLDFEKAVVIEIE